MALAGFNGKVTTGAGATTIAGIGTWESSGTSADEIDISQFGDNWKQTMLGMKDGGDYTFSGLADPSDTTGQQALAYYNNEGTDVTDIQFWISTTQYYEPCQTEGYFSPTTTSGANTPTSYVHISEVKVTTDKSDAVQVSFTAKVSGAMVLVDAA